VSGSHWRRAAALLLCCPAALAAQGADVPARLAARGLPPELVRSVAAVAQAAAARGLPANAVADRAIEGWAKHAPAARIVAAVEQYAGRLGDAREAVGQAGIAAPPPAMIVAAAEALGRGLGPGQVGAVVRASSTPDAVAPGLSVATALAADGLTPDAAVGVVVSALHEGRSAEQILDIPSTARAMRAGGMDPGEVGRRMMHGEGSGGGRQGGDGPRPAGMPAGVPGRGGSGHQSGGHRPPGGG
jgi:hypothetical protein